MPDLAMTGTERLAVAREALREITAESTVGELQTESVAEDGVVTLEFKAEMAGYPGWHWTVSLAELPGEAPTVLEAELLPGDGALLAPDWVPWSERLEEYRAAQAAAAAEAGDGDEAGVEGDDGDDEDADDELDQEDEGDDLDHDDLDHEDLGDDPDDGIDFEHLADEEATALGLDDEDGDEDDEDDDADDGELDVPAVGVEQTDEPEGEADDAGPQPPAEAGFEDRAQEEE